MFTNETNTPSRWSMFRTMRLTFDAVERWLLGNRKITPLCQLYDGNVVYVPGVPRQPCGHHSYIWGKPLIIWNVTWLNTQKMFNVLRFRKILLDSTILIHSLCSEISFFHVHNYDKSFEIKVEIFLQNTLKTSTPETHKHQRKWLSRNLTEFKTILQDFTTLTTVLT